MLVGSWKAGAAALMACMLAAGAPAQALPFGVGGGGGAKVVEMAADNPGDTASHFAQTAVAGLKGVRRVAIAQFQVEYVERSQGLARQERNQVTVQYAFKGPAADAMQAETDKLQERFVGQLKAAGFEVVPREEIEAATAWKKLGAIGKPSGVDFKSESGTGRLFTGAARPYYFYPGDPHLGSGGMAWNFASAQVAEQALATELNAAVMTVRVVVGIRETDKHSQLLAIVRTASSFMGDPRVAVEAPYSGVYLMLPSKKYARASLAVKDTLLFREDLLTPTLKDATGAAGTASNAASTALFTAVALANFAGGGMSGKLYKSYTFESSPPEADYVAAVDRNLSGLEDAWIAELKAAAE